MDKHWDKEYRDGGSISSDRRFTEWDFNKLMASDKFRAVWSGNLWEIIEEGRTRVLGKFNPKTKSLYISGDKNMDNFLVVWMTENGFVNSDEYAILENGGGVGNDWFWNHAYRHYMRDASLEQRNKVKAQFIKEGLELDGESPRHSAIISSIVGEYANGGGIERIDLFEDYENIPTNIQEILDEYSQDFEDGNYDGLAKALEEVESQGYTFEYYLDGQAYGLRPIGVPLNELKGYEDMGEEYAGGGAVGRNLADKIIKKLKNKGYSNGDNLKLTEKFNGKEINLNFYFETEAGDWNQDIGASLEQIQIISKYLDFDRVDGLYEISGDAVLDWKLYKGNNLVCSIGGYWDAVEEYQPTVIKIGDIESSVFNFYPLDGMGGLDTYQFEKNLKNALNEIKQNNLYSAVVSLEGYEQYSEKVDGLENAKQAIQDIKENTRFQVVKGDVATGDLIKQDKVIENYAEGGGIKEKELWFSPYGEVKAEKRGTAKNYIEKHLAKSFGAEYMELVGEDENDYIYELNGNPMMIAAKTAILQEETDLDIETYGRKKRVHIPKKSIDQTSVHLRYPLITPFKNGGAIKTDFNELENTELRNVLISFWNDFFNNHIGNYLSIEKENYILSNIDNVFVIVRDEDKGNFSDVEKQNIDSFLSPYFDSYKKPLFTDFFNNYEIKDNKIIIYIKDMYAKGGGVGDDFWKQYSNDALNDMIVNLSRFENTEDMIEAVKFELKNRSHGNSKYWVWYVNESNPIKNERKAQSFFTNDKQEAINFAYSVRRGYSKVAENKNNGFNSFMWLIDAIPTYEQDFNDTIPNRYTKRYDNGGGVDYDTRWAEMEAYSPYTSRTEYENKKEYEYLAFASKTFSKTSEMLVRENLNNGEICMCKLTKILGHEPNYPIQIVGSLKLEKCFMKRFYRIV